MKCLICENIYPPYYKKCPICDNTLVKEEFVQIVEDKEEEISVHVAQGEFKFEELE